MWHIGEFLNQTLSKKWHRRIYKLNINNGICFIKNILTTLAVGFPRPWPDLVSTKISSGLVWKITRELFHYCKCLQIMGRNIISVCYLNFKVVKIEQWQCCIIKQQINYRNRMYWQPKNKTLVTWLQQTLIALIQTLFDGGAHKPYVQIT